MTLSDKQWEFLKDLSLLLQWLQRKGVKATGGELHRPQEMQDIYVKEGKSKTSDSLHLKKLAIDLFFFIGGEIKWDSASYREAGEFWESLREENRWGGNFSTIGDPYHFERQEYVETGNSRGV